MYSCSLATVTPASTHLICADNDKFPEGRTSTYILQLSVYNYVNNKYVRTETVAYFSNVVFAHMTQFTAALAVLEVRVTARCAESREMLYYTATVCCTRHHAVFIPPTLPAYREIEVPCCGGGRIWPHLESCSTPYPLLCTLASSGELVPWYPVSR